MEIVNVVGLETWTIFKSLQKCVYRIHYLNRVIWIGWRWLFHSITLIFGWRLWSSWSTFTIIDQFCGGQQWIASRCWIWWASILDTRWWLIFLVFIVAQINYVWLRFLEYLLLRLTDTRLIILIAENWSVLFDCCLFCCKIDFRVKKILFRKSFKWNFFVPLLDRNESPNLFNTKFRIPSKKSNIANREQEK